LNPVLLLTFTRQDLVDRYSTSLLGGLWTLINPLVQILIFTLVFSKIMGARLATLGVEFNEYGYSIYLIPAVLSWAAFANTLTRVTTIFQDKAGVISKISIPLAILPLYIVLSESIIFMISMTFFAGFLLLIDFPISLMWLWILPIYLIQQLLAYSLGFGAAVLGVFIRDVVELVKVLVYVWFWLTPIVYVIDIVPAEYETLFALNPMATLIAEYRQVILYAELPDLRGLLVLSAMGVGLMMFALYGFKKLEKDLRDFI
jgi:lipopolysaccharide transport system permease protein